PLRSDFSTSFTAVSDVSHLVDIHFTTSRSNRSAGTVSWDVTLTNRSTFDLFLPLVLVLDPAQGYPGIPQGASGRAPDGRWFIDLSALLPDGQRLRPGQSTAGRTLTIYSAPDRRVRLTPVVAAAVGANERPVFDTTPVTQAAAGQPYVYDADAHDADS